MIPTPHYHSHEHQRAMLGCAADLDPGKHPRRYALYLARNKTEFVDVKARPKPRQKSMNGSARPARTWLTRRES